MPPRHICGYRGRSFDRVAPLMPFIWHLQSPNVVCQHAPVAWVTGVSRQLRLGSPERLASARSMHTDQVQLPRIGYTLLRVSASGIVTALYIAAKLVGPPTWTRKSSTSHDSPVDVD
jgi:hypothetical protein